MIKTKITFAEIQPGDLIEVVHVGDGVKSVETGIAFEYDGDYISGYGSWFTSEVGLLVVEDASQTIYRIDVREVKFDDVQIGDLIKVTYEPTKGDMIEVTKTGIVYTNHNGAWVTPAYETLVTVGGRGKIEILERGE
jgi:hypothetical protein